MPISRSQSQPQHSWAPVTPRTPHFEPKPLLRQSPQQELQWQGGPAMWSSRPCSPCGHERFVPVAPATPPVALRRPVGVCVRASSVGRGGYLTPLKRLGVWQGFRAFERVSVMEKAPFQGFGLRFSSRRVVKGWSHSMPAAEAAGDSGGSSDSSGEAVLLWSEAQIAGEHGAKPG